MLKRLIEIEKKTQKIVKKNTENITTLYDINFQTNTYAAATQRDTGTRGHVAAPAAPSPSSHSPPPPQPQPQPQPQLQSQTSEGHLFGGTVPNTAGQNSALPSNRVTTQSDNGDRIVVSTTGTPIRRTNGGPRVVADPNQAIANRGNEAYQAARSRRDRDRRTVYGTRQHETPRGAKNINFFVFRVDKKNPQRTLRLVCQRYTKCNCCVSHADARSKSFKVSVKLQDKDKILSSDFWPAGVACRLFYEKRVNGNAPSRRSSVSENIEQS